MLLLQHQKDILSLWKAVKHLQQEFQAWTRVPQVGALTGLEA